MGFLNLLFAIFFVGAAAYDAALVYSAVINRLHHRNLNSLEGLLGKITGLEGLIPQNNVKQELYIGWVCDLLLIVWNAFDFYQMGPSFFLGYSIIGILIGGIYFHHHFVKDHNHLINWYVQQMQWSNNTNSIKLTHHCLRWVVIDNLYSLLVINVPLVVVSII